MLYFHAINNRYIYESKDHIRVDHFTGITTMIMLKP